MAPAPPGQKRRRHVSPILRRILAVNLLALGILVAGLLYLGEYRRNMIAAEVAALAMQVEMFAAALGESAVTTNDGGQAHQHQVINPSAARQIVRRLVEPTGTRARLFGADGVLIVDSRLLFGPGGIVQIETLPPPTEPGGALGVLLGLYDRLASLLPGTEDQPVYRENREQRAADYEEVVVALSGETGEAVRRTRVRLLLSAAAPVQRYKQVSGALMLSKDSRDIDAALLDVRVDILKVFGVALGITILLSVYLAGTIARPLRRLAASAQLVRHGRNRQYGIPRFSGRNDEIGDLAESLSEMTEALWQRLDAIEGFAADVAHEIKNPLTSLHSAVETAARVKDPEQQRKLMGIIKEDVLRLDRLISDISDASRLDAELSRAESGPVNVGGMLATVADLHQQSGSPDAPRISVDIANGRDLTVQGIEGRLVQVFRNLITNAVSFSPPGGEISMRAHSDGDWIEVEISDQGPGIPSGKEEDIFERFYTERRDGEAFGTHSGLGLSISKQIVEAHRGRIVAENRISGQGRVRGARFVVRLPRK